MAMVRSTLQEGLSKRLTMPDWRCDIWWGIGRERWYMLWAVGDAAFTEPGFGYIVGGPASRDTLPVSGKVKEK